MKIAFWSNSSGRSGVTGNLCCISILSALCQPKSSILVENHRSMNSLESALIQRNSKHFDKRIIPIFDNRIFYLSDPEMNGDLLDYCLQEQRGGLLDYLARQYDDVYVDLSPTVKKSTRTILEQADIIVVNLCQNTTVLDHFFHNYHHLREKCFFLLGNYDSQSILSQENIRKKYKISYDQMGIIPYNRGFADALMMGEVVSFLKSHYRCKREDIYYDFMQEVLETVDRYRVFQSRRGGDYYDKRKEHIMSMFCYDTDNDFVNSAEGRGTCDYRGAVATGVGREWRKENCFR